VYNAHASAANNIALGHAPLHAYEISDCGDIIQVPDDQETSQLRPKIRLQAHEAPTLGMTQ